jgi:hypothetical protein
MGRRNDGVRPPQAGAEQYAATLGRRMTKKLSARLSYALVLSIVLLMTGFLGLGVRAFKSAMISYSIYLGAFGAFLVAVSLYFVRRRPLAGAAIGRKIPCHSAAWPLQVRPYVAPGRSDRRRPFAQGQEWAVVALERRSNQLAGLREVGPKAIGSEALRG